MLSKRLALCAAREKWPADDFVSQIVPETINHWMAASNRTGTRLRGTKVEYAHEAGQMILGAHRTRWFKAASEKWERWRRDPEFPLDGSPADRLLFAIQRHCSVHRTSEFFISCRDAAIVSGREHTQASQLLKQLVRNGYMELLDRPERPARHAYEYRLLDPASA
jgi:hypothetical protein